MIPVEESFAAWRKNPEYEKAYNPFEEEFALSEPASLRDAASREKL
jgi:hypothetical protein